MSGIAGIMRKDAGAGIAAMLDRISHRGPDGRMIAGNGTGTFGGVLLSAGPFGAAGPFLQQNKMAVWDGEIYNFEELKEDSGLDAEKDVELILRLYEKEGSDFVGRLDGPFALAIQDGENLFMARDALGQAPLFYGRTEGGLCFASEMKALQEATDDIRFFPPGHVWRNGELKTFPPRRSEIPADSDAAEIAAQLRRRLEKSVGRRAAGVPRLGVWLSGGLDSSALAALASSISGNVSTFSAGTESAPDLAFARETAEYLGTDHHEYLYTVEDMLEALPRVIYHLESFDAPLVRSSIANYLVAREAGKHVRVVLSGEGGDELFAGYSYLKGKDEEDLRTALSEAQAALHNTALQRVDRMAAAHGTRARTAFLDPDVTAYANAIPGRLKICGPEKIEKWILRKAMEGRLPEGVLWRPKEKFWSGSGIAGKLEEIAEQRISDEEFLREREIVPGHILPSREDLFYWRIFRRYYPQPGILKGMGRTVHRENR